MNEKIVEINKLCFSYEKSGKSKEVLFDQMELCVEKGESVGIIGANGAGKSTLLKLMVGLNLDFEGNIKICGLDVSKKNLKEIRKNTGFVFQDAENQLFMTTVEEDVAFGPVNYGMSQKEVEESVETALSKVNALELKKRYIFELSGGEKKLVSLATILSLNPSLILLDEPSIALDPKNRRNLIKVLNELDSTKIITSHDLDFVWDTCSKVIVMNKGKITVSGKCDEILRNKELLEENGLELPLSLTGR